MPSLRKRSWVVLGAVVAIGGWAFACTGLKAGGDGADAGEDVAVVLPPGETEDGATIAEDGAIVPGPRDAATDATDAQYQFDGGITPPPTCVDTTRQESWVPAAGCVPNAGPGRCSFVKVVRTCKSASCRGGYCQDLDFTAQPVATPPKFVYQVWGAAPDALWAVGPSGVYAYDGTIWKTVDVGVTFDNTTEAFAVGGTTREDVTILTGNHVAGPMTLRRRNTAGQWKVVNQINDRVWGGGLFALGADRFLVHLGSRGVYFCSPTQTSFLGLLYGFPATHHYTNALSGYLANDVLVASAGADGTLYFDGSELKKVGPPAHAVLYTKDVLGFVSVGSKLDLFTPGGARIGAQVDLSTAAGAGTTWKGIDGTGAERLWVVSDDAVLVRRDTGGTFRRETLPDALQANAVFASPWGDVYVAGSRVYHGK